MLSKIATGGRDDKRKHRRKIWDKAIYTNAEFAEERTSIQHGNGRTRNARVGRARFPDWPQRFGKDKSHAHLQRDSRRTG